MLGHYSVKLSESRSVSIRMGRQRAAHAEYQLTVRQIAIS
jgi:hypothetical protein